MLKRFELFLIAAVFVLISAIILIFYTGQREKEFIEHHSETQKSAVHGAAYALGLQLTEKHRHVRLFLNEYQQLVTRLIRNPNDEKTEQNIKLRMQQRFTDFFTFTISDQSGKPMIVDVESLVGEACQLDLEGFANNIRKHRQSVRNEVFLHPQPFHYHYDIMAPLYSRDDKSPARIFFSSFYPDTIVDNLKTHQTPGQTLYLVKRSDPTLIEISATGARDKMDRGIRLSDDEIRRTRASEDIPGTNWRLISLTNEDYENNYIGRLWREAIVIVFVVTQALFILIFLMGRIRKA